MRLPITVRDQCGADSVHGQDQRQWTHQNAKKDQPDHQHFTHDRNDPGKQRKGASIMGNVLDDSQPADDLLADLDQALALL